MTSYLPAHRAALLGKPDMLPNHCIVCGQSANNAHHAIPGRRRDPLNPRVRLCGSGVTGCHGAAHEKRLHLRYRDGWEWLHTNEPTSDTDALDLTYWRPCRDSVDW